jgi:hypothetical protein
VPARLRRTIAGNSDGSTVDRPDTHISPEAALRWSRQFSSFRLSAMAATVFDRYQKTTTADLNTVEGGLKVSFTDGHSDIFVPYISYVATTYFDRDFKSLDDRRHDVAAGFSSGFGFRGGQSIAYRDARHAGDSTIVFDVQLGERLANIRNAEHTFADTSIEYAYGLRDDLVLVLTPKARLRVYDDFNGHARNDLRLGAKAMLAWSPDWLTAKLPGAEIQLSAEYMKNISTEATAKYSLFEFGPMLGIKHKF